MDYADIVSNPTGCNVPDEPGILFATVAMLAKKYEKKDLGKVMQYANRLGFEFQYFLIKDIVNLDPTAFNQPDVRNWFKVNSVNLA